MEVYWFFLFLFIIYLIFYCYNPEDKTNKEKKD